MRCCHDAGAVDALSLVQPGGWDPAEGLSSTVPQGQLALQQLKVRTALVTGRASAVLRANHPCLDAVHPWLLRYVTAEELALEVASLGSACLSKCRQALLRVCLKSSSLY